MRPSVRAEKYIRDASGWRKDVTDGNDNGADGQTDRQSATQYAAPPREEGRIIILIISKAQPQANDATSTPSSTCLYLSTRTTVLSSDDVSVNNRPRS